MKSCRFPLFVGFFMICLIAGVSAQAKPVTSTPDSLLSLGLTPNFSIPIGRDTALFSYGGGANLNLEYRLPFLSLLYLGTSAGYSYAPLQAVSSVSLVHGGVSAGIRLDIMKNLAIRAHGSGGYFYSFLNDGSGRGGGNPLFTGGVDLSWAFVPELSLGIGASYRYFAGLYHDIAATLGISYNFPVEGSGPVRQRNQSPGRPQPLGSPDLLGEYLQISELSIGNVFPVLHAFYDTNALGSLTISNTGKVPVTNIDVTFIVRQFMDAPKECGTIAELEPGEQQKISLFALFKNTIFETKESTKVPAEIKLTYTVKGEQQTALKVETLRVYDRNAMTWDDTNKAAAFVMPKEPAVLMLSNQIASFVKDSMNRIIDKNLQTAMALHDALRLAGISYVSPPLTSYAVRSQDKAVVDSVKFPLETIDYRSGDCSDLSVLYCSLLESVQVETAFITIPAHIFMAFALTTSEDETRRTFSTPGEFIFRDGKVWVPVEVTERSGPFLAAWQLGAKEWRENGLKGQARFYPVRGAWGTYEPVNFPGIGNKPAIPDSAKVVKDFQGDVAALINREIAGKEAVLAAAVKSTGGSAKALNSMGLLYARFDLSNKAEDQFKAALKKSEYPPALINLGNLYYLRGKMDQALTYYQRAFAKDSHSPSVLLALARVNHEMQNYGVADKQYAELRSLRPDLADQFAYLQTRGEESTRAAEASRVRDQVLWEEGK